MSKLMLLPACPALDEGWLRQFATHLLRKRPKLPLSSAREFATHAFQAMFLLPPAEACDLWDDAMRAQVADWDLLA